MSKKWVLFLVGFSFAFPLHAQEKKIPFECRWTDRPIVIDGKGDEEAWKFAQPINHFYLPWLGEKARPGKTATKAKLLWDREYLYFFADMEDSDLFADTKEQDGQLWLNDVFELFFKPADDKPGYYEFQVNPAGAVLDMFIPRRGAGGFQRFIKEGKFHIDAKVTLNGTLNNWRDKDKGWTVEGKIPWKDFLRTGGRPEPGEKWKFALCRYDYSVDFEGPELSTSGPLNSKKQPDFHAFEDYAPITFVGPAQETSLPYGVEKRISLTSSKVVGFPDPPPPFRVQPVFTQLEIELPVEAYPQPGTNFILAFCLGYSQGDTILYRFKDDPKVKEKETVLKLPDVAYNLAFHPRFQENGFFYVGRNGRPAGTEEKKKNRITRYTMNQKSPFAVDPKSAEVIIEWESDGHNGAAMAFGKDGMLYITSGDGTSDSDTNVTGQDMTTLLAKVLRIDVDHPEPGKKYAVPKDNPFVKMKDARPEIWALGLRNPWRMTVDAKTGHLWVGNNGQDLWEQAYLVKKADNFGWSVTEGSHPFYPARKLGPGNLVKPTVEHHHSEARSLTGGIVYYGKKYPELQGAYIYGDYSSGKIWAVSHDGGKIVWHKEIADSRLTITGFGTDSQGEILIAHFQKKDKKGGFYTLIPTPKDAAPSVFPRKLSDSGLFQSVKGHVMKDALIPYSVNAVLWSDGVSKERWLGIPADGKIEFTSSRGWNFPDLTVIVKSFHLDLEEGNPGSRKWIETRFLTKQGPDWYGYSYQWNDEQTEGILVESKGLDREFTIKGAKSKENPEGVRKLNWHYPSRSECMACHSRAANWVLGLTEVQMNKVHNYGKVSDHQLRTLEHLGLLQVNYASEAKAKMREECKERGLTAGQIDEYMKEQTETRGQREAKAASSLLTYSPEKYRKLADPYDKKQDINLRARSYLHSNCSQCHVEAGGGNAQMELEFTTLLEKMKIINAAPVHDTFGLKNAKLISPGNPEESILLHRVGHRNRGHMPPLATREVDRQSVELLREWILQLK